MGTSGAIWDDCSALDACALLRRGYARKLAGASCGCRRELPHYVVVLKFSRKLHLFHSFSLPADIQTADSTKTADIKDAWADIKDPRLFVLKLQKKCKCQYR
jgi:hypothetical protein